MEDDNEMYVYCRACQTYFDQNDLASHDKMCTASKSVVKRFVGNRYDMVPANQVPDSEKPRRFLDHSTSSNYLENTMLQSKDKLKGIFNSAKSLNINFGKLQSDFVKQQQNSMTFICTICGDQLDQTEIGDHISTCTPPDGFIGSQFMVLEDYMKQKEEEAAKEEKQVAVENMSSESDKKKKRKHRHTQTNDEDAENQVKTAVEEEPIYLCTVCSKQLKASECAEHSQTCKQPKNMSGSQFFLIESDKPEDSMSKKEEITESVSTDVNSSTSGESEKKKKRRKHRKADEDQSIVPIEEDQEGAPTSQSSDKQNIQESEQVSPSVSQHEQDVEQVDNTEGEKKKKRKHRHHVESDNEEESHNVSVPETSTSTSVEQKAENTNEEEPIYLCTVCSKQLKASECAEHSQTCKQPKNMSGSQFFLIESDKPEDSMSKKEEITESISTDVNSSTSGESEKKKKRRKHRSTSPLPEDEETIKSEISQAESSAPVTEVEPTSFKEPTYICQVCGKNFTQLECIDHTMMCKPPKSFSGSQFLMIEEEQEVEPHIIEKTTAVTPSSLTDLAQKAKEIKIQEELAKQKEIEEEKLRVLEEAKRRANRNLIDEDEDNTNVTDDKESRSTNQFITLNRPNHKFFESSSSSENEEVGYEFSDSESENSDDDSEITSDHLSIHLDIDDYENPFDIRAHNELKPSLYIPTDLLCQLQMNSNMNTLPINVNLALSPVDMDLEDLPMENTKDENELKATATESMKEIDLSNTQEETQHDDDNNHDMTTEDEDDKLMSELDYHTPSVHSINDNDNTENNVHDIKNTETETHTKSLLEIAEERRKQEEEEYNRMIERQKKQKEEQEKREREIAEEKKRQRLAEIKRIHDIETHKKADIMKVQRDYILFTSWMEVGCNCIKYCSNGESHNTTIRLKSASNILKNSFTWERKAGGIKSHEGSILISSIHDVMADGPRRCIITNDKRKYSFEFFTKQEQQTFVSGIKTYLDYYKQRVAALPISNKH